VHSSRAFTAVVAARITHRAGVAKAGLILIALSPGGTRWARCREAAVVLNSRLIFQQPTTAQDAFPGLQLLRLQAFGSRIVGNAAVEGLSSPNVIEPVPLSFGDRCVAHHQLL
jgi:hypothetical protein